MSALSIQPTFPIFTGTDGLPLENGYIWIGAANLDPQGNPITVYWDAALTIAAAQPIRTLAGYPSRSGTPARVYVNSDYSIRVQDKNASTVYSAPQATERISSDLVTYQPPFTGGVAIDLQDKLAQTLSVKDFGAVGDGVVDDTAAIQAAIDSITLAGTLHFPQGVYKITSTISILGNTRNITCVGDNGVESIVPGGALLASAPVIQWHGANNGVMFLLDSVEGTQIERIAFQTYTTNVNVIQITGVYGIRYINKSSCRFSTIRNCSFRNLYAGVHYYDDGTNVSSNTNMDGHLVEQCLFTSCVVGILIDQSNVYDTEFFRCSFYGSTSYTKHHVWVKKGHCSIRSCFLGKLKNAASAGGKDGIALLVTEGWMHSSDTYSEADNGPFFVWEAASPVDIGCGIVNCIILNTTASLPTTYNLLNKTESNVSIFGGRISGTVSQFAGTTGTISLFNCVSPSFDSTSEPNAITYFGSKRNNQPGAFGTVPVGTTGGGKATLEGYSPELSMINDGDSTKVTLTYATSILSFDKPGFTNGPKFNYSTGILDLVTPNWGLQLTGSLAKPLKLNNTLILTGTGSPESVIAAPVGSMWLRTDGGAGSTQYIKESGFGNTGWVAK